MNVQKIVRQLKVIDRRRRAANFFGDMTAEEREIIKSLPPKKKQQFLKRLQAAFDGNLRYKFPVIEVDQLPGTPER